MRSRDISPERRSLWVIAKYEGGRVDGVFTVDCDGDGQVLPVFGREEDAEAFLRHLGETGNGWRTRETGVGELTSLLCGPCADVNKVALDASSDASDGRLSGSTSQDPERFLQELLGKGGRWAIPAKENGKLADIPDYVLWDFDRFEEAPAKGGSRRRGAGDRAFEGVGSEVTLERRDQVHGV